MRGQRLASKELFCQRTCACKKWGLGCSSTCGCGRADGKCLKFFDKPDTLSLLRGIFEPLDPPRLMSPCFVTYLQQHEFLHSGDYGDTIAEEMLSKVLRTLKYDHDDKRSSTAWLKAWEQVKARPVDDLERMKLRRIILVAALSYNPPQTPYVFQGWFSLCAHSQGWGNYWHCPDCKRCALAKSWHVLLARRRGKCVTCALFREPNVIYSGSREAGGNIHRALSRAT
ncbi:hypothetical protein B0H63DRAFT_469731 [Podospora didyma]|uniref:Uncharacterized protein n=1 Tax=Podospora didyma TaxID=330526 RepID=A0AAE0NT81_9PEZI|nr:hypothetical protein B0H63DRAFT_469731 [Podospora didyma]